MNSEPSMNSETSDDAQFLNEADSESGNQRVPKVFISYSHDSKEHKRWVINLARRLRSEGVDVTLDDWDLPPGGDIPKFMERSVKQAERVLMVCTDTYVQKVDDGIGGAGYEGMIVTAELVHNLGVKKFIPLVRQPLGTYKMPACLGVRLAINFSNDADFEAEYTRLYSELFEDPPPTKPSLGKRRAPVAVAAIVAPGISGAAADDAEQAFQQALTLARGSDVRAWRKLISSARSRSVEGATQWARSSQNHTLPTIGDAVAKFAEGLTFYQPLFALALAGVDSGNETFAKQGALLHDLISLEPWWEKGLHSAEHFPEGVGFVFQALLGAKYIHIERLDLLTDFASQRFSTVEANETGRLFESNRLIGWPQALGGHCTIAWDFLWNLGESNKWIQAAFDTTASFRESLCGYYATLSWMEFVERVRKGSSDLHRPHVPVCYAKHKENVRGLRLALQGREELRNWAHPVTFAAQNEQWPDWMAVQADWLGNVFKHQFTLPGGHERARFLEDIYAGHEGPASPGITTF